MNSPKRTSEITSKQTDIAKLWSNLTLNRNTGAIIVLLFLNSEDLDLLELIFTLEHTIQYFREGNILLLFPKQIQKLAKFEDTYVNELYFELYIFPILKENNISGDRFLVFETSVCSSTEITVILSDSGLLLSRPELLCKLTRDQVGGFGSESPYDLFDTVNYHLEENSGLTYWY